MSSKIYFVIHVIDHQAQQQSLTLTAFLDFWHMNMEKHISKKHIWDVYDVDVHLPMKYALFPEMSRSNHLIYIYYRCKQALILLPYRTDRGQISAQIPTCCHAYQCGSTFTKLPTAKPITIQSNTEIIYMFSTILMSIQSSMLNIVCKKSIIFLFSFPIQSVFRYDTKTIMLARKCLSNIHITLDALQRSLVLSIA